MCVCVYTYTRLYMNEGWEGVYRKAWRAGESHHVCEERDMYAYSSVMYVRKNVCV